MKVAVFSGGGVKGAIQIGALGTALRHGTSPYDAFFGVSTGALTAAVMAAAATQGGQVARAGQLCDIYLNIRGNRSIYRGATWWPLAALRFLLGRAAFNPVGLWTLLRDKLRPLAVPMGCGVTDLRAGTYHGVLFPADETPSPEIVLASASMPVFFPPVSDALADGGVFHQTPLSQAVQWLKTAMEPGNGSEPEVHLFLTSPLQPDRYTGSLRGVAGAERVLSLLESAIYASDLAMTLHRNSNPGDLRVRVTTYIPDSRFDGVSALTFDPTTIAQMLTYGAQIEPQVRT